MVVSCRLSLNFVDCQFDIALTLQGRISKEESQADFLKIFDDGRTNECIETYAPRTHKVKLNIIIFDNLIIYINLQ